MNQIATDAADPGHVSAELLRCNLDALGGQSRHDVDRRNRLVLTHRARLVWSMPHGENERSITSSAILSIPDGTSMLSARADC
jgi:hypothetical protein